METNNDLEKLKKLVDVLIWVFIGITVIGLIYVGFTLSMLIDPESLLYKAFYYLGDAAKSVATIISAITGVIVLVEVLPSLVRLQKSFQNQESYQGLNKRMSNDPIAKDLLVSISAWGNDGRNLGEVIDYLMHNHNMENNAATRFLEDLRYLGYIEISNNNQVLVTDLGKLKFRN